jgi:hypothetical protein
MHLVAAVDLPAGKPRWRLWLSPPGPDLGERPALLLDEDVVYVSALYGRLLALDRTDGRAAWDYGVGGRSWPLLARRSDGDRLIVPTESGEVFAFERAPRRPREQVFVQGRLRVPPDVPGPWTLEVRGRRVITDRQGRFQLHGRPGESFQMAIDHPDIAHLRACGEHGHWGPDGAQYLDLSREPRQVVQVNEVLQYLGDCP